MTDDLAIGTLAASSFLFPDILPSQLTTHSPAVLYLYEQWVKADYLFDGTEAMRIAARRFLPQEDQETDSAYHRRLHRSTLFNAYKNAIKTGSGRVFTKDVCLEGITDANETDGASEASVPVEMQNFSQDVDAQGRNLSQFAKAMFESGINHGVTFALVDHARVPLEVATLAEFNASGVRPYWITIKATQVHDVQTREVNGVQKLSLFRYAEVMTETADDDLTPVIHEQIRIYRLNNAGSGVDFAVYRASGQVNAKLWNLIDSGSLVGVSEIPVVPFYTDRVSFYLGKPALMDLIDMNIHHWQVSSDHTNIQHIANVPFLFGQGLRAEMDEDGVKKPFVLSPYTSVMVDSVDAKLGWVEHSGKTLDAARAYLDRVEQQMDKVGLAMTAPNSSGTVTATENALNASESNSVLKGWAMSLQDALNMLLMFTSQYLAIADTSRTCVNTDYAVDYTANDTFADVLALLAASVIDAETAIAEAKRRNIIDPAAEIVIPEPPPPPVIVQAPPAAANDPIVNTQEAA